jgi:prophage tail gpP-like protein
MSIVQDQLIVVIDGETHKGWLQAQVSRSIQRGPHSFSLSLTDRWGSKESASPRSIKVGMTAELFINDELLISGYIDDVAPSYDDKTHSIKIKGRSKLADLVDCSSAGKQFKNQSLMSICNTLCKPFGINVLVSNEAKSDANKVFTGRTHTLDLGQTLWDFLEELAKIRGVLLTSNASGDLVILRAGTAKAEVALALGKNIKAAKGSFNSTELYSEYNVSGQQPSAPKDLGFIGAKVSQPKAQAKAQVKSKGINRYRPFYVSSDNPLSVAQCQSRADWQKNVHEGRAESISYTLSGWRQTVNGKLWQPNELVEVVDAWMGMDDERLIVETVFTLNESGSNTDLTLMPKSAFAKKPAEPSKASKKSKKLGFLSPTGEQL